MHIVFLVFIFALKCFYTYGSLSFNVHRAIHDSQQYGCRRTAIDCPVSSDIQVLNSSSPFFDLQRRAILVDIFDISLANINSILHERKASGLVLLLYPNTNFTLQESNYISAIEDLLSTSSFDTAVYFSFYEKELESLVLNLKIDAMKRGTYPSTFFPTVPLSHIDYRMVITAPEAEVIKSSNTIVFYTSLTVSTDLPTILIHANYDSLSLSPTLSSSVYSGSSLASLLALFRYLSQLFTENKARPEFNILFVVSGGSKLHHIGINSWLDKNTDSKLLDSIDFVLCLDSIFSLEHLYLHVSRPPKTNETRFLYNLFNETAINMNINFDILHRKINVSSQYPDWPHEVFAKKRLFAMTLSSYSHPQSFDSLTHNYEKINIKDVETITHYIINILGQYLYSVDYSTIKHLSSYPHGINTNFLNDFLLFIGKMARPAAFLNKDSDIIKQIERYLNRYANSPVLKATFPILSNITFYRNVNFPSPLLVTLYLTRPFYFDIVFSLLLFFGFILFYLSIQLPRSPSEALDSLKTFFSYKMKKS